MTRASSSYIGRFAPSPTGPLHFGSAVAAIASFLDARANNGRWLLRIEDIDPPREQAGAAQSIIKTLTTLGMQWDGEIIFQSERTKRYDLALEKLEREERLYRCGCTRREIGTGPYPGTCRDGLPRGKTARSTRFRVPDAPIEFIDDTYGRQVESIEQTIGDFNLVRADGLYSYHLAVVVDDAEQGITHIVRGVDLLSSTARQIALQQALGYPTPHYRHIPVVRDADGNKLSKQTGATGIEDADPVSIWQQALSFLNQESYVAKAPCLPALIAFAIDNWQTSRIRLPSTP